MKLQPGKRYWFHNMQHIYNALYTGEQDSNNSNGIFIRRNGNVWSIPIEDIYQSKEDLLKSLGIKHYKLCDK